MTESERAMTELEKAAEEYVKYCNYSDVNEPYSPGEVELECTTAFKAGTEWQAKQSPWISVKERLPTYQDGLVNIRCRNKNKEDGIWLYDICFIDEETNTWAERHHTWESITHWCPIPE